MYGRKDQKCDEVSAENSVLSDLAAFYDFQLTAD